MAFRSQLDTIVRLRRLLEERQEISFRLSKLKLNECVAKVERLREMERSLSEVAGSFAEATQAIELHVAEMRRRMVTEALRSARARSEILGKDVDVERERLQVMQHEREMVETLRDAAREEWLRKKGQAEQRFVDEMFLVRRNRDRGGDGSSNH